jgi:carboxypeptidase family protein/TonB-dependent receptor-like protein
MEILASRAPNVWRALVAGIAVLVFCFPASAQSNLGRISGSITDKSGGVIVNATVTVTDTQRGISRTLTTDDAGEYTAPNILPGVYTVRAEATGFNKIERQNIRLEVGKDVRVDLTLQPGEQTTMVTVTEELPLVETTNSTLGGTLSNETINDLPLNGRNYQNLVVLRPGSMVYPGGGGWTQSTNGSHPEDNGYIVDGLTNDHPLTALTVINGAGVEGDAATILPIDAIQEFNVIENPPAQYGWKTGAIVNVGLKSGTNNLHGTAYAFGRSDALDARNYFNAPANSAGQCLIFGNVVSTALTNPCEKSPVELEQFGATLGGPIKKDKLFFFLGFEDERYSLLNLFQRNLPETGSQAANPPPTPNCPNTVVGNCASSLPDSILGVESLGIQPSALSMHLVGCTQANPAAVPVCTGGLFPANAGTNVAAGVGYDSTFRSDNGLAKIDYHINDKNTLTGMYFISRGDIVAQDPGTFAELQPYWRSHQSNEPQVFGVNWTYVPNSHWVNEARFGIIYMNRENNTLDNNVPATTYGINTGVTAALDNGFPTLLVAGLSPLGGFPGWPIEMGPTWVYQGVDNVSYLHGKHAFKFGGELHKNSVTAGRFSYGKGVILFTPGAGGAIGTPLEDFMAGDGGVAKFLVGTTPLQMSTWQYALFAEDEWRLKPRITLTYGLRYEYITPLSEANNQLGNFDPNAPTGLVQIGNQIKTPYNADHLDFGPRVGLAWDLTGNGTTVVHAGASVVTDDGIPMFLFVGQGGEQNNTTLGLGAIPTGAEIFENGAQVGTFGGNINYAVVKTGGPPFAAHWQSQPGDGTGTPLWSTTPVCGDGVAGKFPCNILGVDRNFRNPFVTTWTLGVEHAFTTDLSLNVAYVGNHGARLPGITDLNQPTPVPGNINPLPGAYATQFPYLGNINWLSNLYTSNYDGMQVTLTQRPFHGLSYVAGYTYSHSLDGSSFNINIPLPQDSRFPQLNYDSSVFDIRHRFTFSTTYAIPGKKMPGQLLEGWELNSIVTLQSGAPWGVDDSSDNISGTNEFTDRWNFSGNPSDFKSSNSSIPYCSGFGVSGDISKVSCTQLTPAGTIPLSNSVTTALATLCTASAADDSSSLFPGGPLNTGTLGAVGCFAQGHSSMTPPAVGHFGNMARNPFRDPGFRDWDLSITKNFQFQERLKAQFRAELFNVLNHPNFANPYGGSNGFGENDPSSPGNFGCGCATPDQAAGNPVLGTGGNRAIQLGLKLIF